MTLEERSNLVLAFAHVLYVNGQATDQTLDAVERLSDSLGVRAKLMPRWGELQLQIEDREARLISLVAANPAGVDKDRVASSMQGIGDLGAGRLSPRPANQGIGEITK